MFNQITLVCDWFWNVDCSQSRQFQDYSNSRLYQEGNVLLDNQDDYELKAATGAIQSTGSARRANSMAQSDSGSRSSSSMKSSSGSSSSQKRRRVKKTRKSSQSQNSQSEESSQQ